MTMRHATSTTLTLPEIVSARVIMSNPRKGLKKMWLSLPKYEALVRAAAKTERLEEDVADLRAQLVKERERAENAIDALLMSKNTAPVTPRKVEDKPEPHPFDEDPEELKRVLLEMGLNPVGTLMTEGVGDAK